MRTLKLTGLIFAIMAITSAPSFAATASCDEAKAMLAKALETYKADGADKAFVKFAAKDGGFIDRDLYVYALDKNGKFLFHGAKPTLVGKDSLPLKDPDGKAFMVEMMAIKGKGTVDYRWADPIDNKVKAKTAFVEWVGDTLLGSGCYKE